MAKPWWKSLLAGRGTDKASMTPPNLGQLSESQPISRRQLLQAAGLTGAAALLGSCSYRRMEESFQASGDYPYAHPENILYSSCLQCNTGCGIKVKVQDGIAVKIDGNPRAPTPFGLTCLTNPHPS